jgi:hypothetical protein
VDLETVVQRRAEPVFTRLDDELLALDPHKASCYALSGTATRVWELISSPIALGTVRDAIVSEFVVDPDTCLADLLELMEQLDAAGLVEVAAPA